MFDAGVTQLKEIAAVDLSSESLIARQSPALVTARYPRPLADQLFAFHGPGLGLPIRAPRSPAHLRPLSGTLAGNQDYLVSISRIKQFANHHCLSRTKLHASMLFFTLY